MKKLILLLSFAAQSLVSTPQFLRDNVSGQPYFASRYADIMGTPLLSDDWSSGIIYLKDGYKADKFPLKFNLHSNELLFEHDNQALVVQNPVKEFIINPTIEGQQLTMLFRCGYKTYDKNDENTYYQVLQDGPSALVKQIRKIVVTNPAYGTSSDKREFSTIEIYFIARPGGDLIKIKKDKNSLLNALSDSKGKLEAWMEKERNKCKTEQDLMSAVKVYNDNAW